MQTAAKPNVILSSSDRPSGELFPPVIETKPIDWPTEREIAQISKRLNAVSQLGIRREAQGDYFNGGDLAYQLHEIIRATTELFKKTRRLERSPAESN